MRVRIRGLLFPPLHREGDGAPKDAIRKWFVPCGTRAPLGAPSRCLPAPGRAFRLLGPAACPLSRGPHAFAPREQAAFGRLDRSPSAGSRQDLIVGPGGAPVPPERSCCGHEPAGTAPRPASRTPHDAPLNWTRCAQCNRGFRGGDKPPQNRHSGASRNPGNPPTCDSGYRLSPAGRG